MVDSDFQFNQLIGFPQLNAGSLQCQLRNTKIDLMNKMYGQRWNLDSIYNNHIQKFTEIDCNSRRKLKSLSNTLTQEHKSTKYPRSVQFSEGYTKNGQKTNHQNQNQKSKQKMIGLLDQKDIKKKINDMFRKKDEQDEEEQGLKEKQKFYHLEKIKYQNYKYSRPSKKYYEMFYPQQRETNIKHFEINCQNAKDCEKKQNKVIKHNQYIYVNNPQLQNQTTDKMIKSSLLRRVKSNFSYDFNKSNKFIIKNKPQLEKYVQQKRNVVNIDKLQFLDLKKNLVFKIDEDTVLLKNQMSNQDNNRSQSIQNQSVQEKNEIYQIINEYNQLLRQYYQYLKQSNEENECPINPYSIQDIQQKTVSRQENQGQDIIDEKSNNNQLESKSVRSQDHNVSHFSGFSSTKVYGKMQFYSLQQPRFVSSKGIEVFVIKQKFQKYFDKMDFAILSRMLMIFGVDLSDAHQQINFCQFQLMYQFLVTQKPYENDLKIFIQRFFCIEPLKSEFIQLMKYLCKNYGEGQNLKNQSRLNNIIKENMLDYFMNIFEKHKVVNDQEQIDTKEFCKIDIHIYYQLYQLVLGSS